MSEPPTLFDLGEAEHKAFVRAVPPESPWAGYRCRYCGARFAEPRQLPDYKAVCPNPRCRSERIGAI